MTIYIILKADRNTNYMKLIYYLIVYLISIGYIKILLDGGAVIDAKTEIGLPRINFNRFCFSHFVLIPMEMLWTHLPPTTD